RHQAAGLSSHPGQTACATSAPKRARSPTHPQSPGSSGHYQPAASLPPAGSCAVVSSQLGAPLRAAATLQDSTVLHIVEVTWPSPSSRDGQYYTAHEFMRRGTKPLPHGEGHPSLFWLGVDRSTTVHIGQRGACRDGDTCSGPKRL